MTNLLGEVVTWDMQAQEIPLQTVVDSLRDAGLPIDDIKCLRATTAFTRAVKDLREGRTIDKVDRDHATGIISFQFTKKALDSGHINFSYEAICRLDPAGWTITCDDSPEIAEHARKMFRRALTHRVASDVTKLVQKLFSGHADLYPINPRKGVAYFVPEAHREFSAKVAQFLESLGGRLSRFPVPKGTPEGNAAVKASVESGLAALAAELESAVDSWSESTRESTFDKAIERWEVIRHKAEAYSEYLGDRQESLLAHLDAQKQRLREKVSALSASKAGVSVPPAEEAEAPTAQTQPGLFPEDIRNENYYYDEESS